MPRSARSTSLNHRADQAGLLVSAANVPLTFQRTLMPRPGIDQALVTGLSIAANHALVALVQETIQTAAFAVGGRRPDTRESDARWSRVAIALDLAAVGAGIGVQRALRQRRREPLPRAAARTGGYWPSMAGTAGAVIGGVQEVRRAVGANGRRHFPAVVPSAALLAAANTVRVHRAERALATGQPGLDAVGTARALGLGVAVAGGTSLFALAERVTADAVADVASRMLPGSREVWRPLGHAAALGAFVGVARLLVERAFRSIEKKETAVEAAFDIAPPNPLLSGSRASNISFDTLS